MKVLVVSHSHEISRLISPVLKVRWPDLSLVYASEAGPSLDLIHKEQPDVVMLHLPERSEQPALAQQPERLLLDEPAASLDYFALISRIRSFSDVPLIVISQSNDIMDRVKALEAGADDWVSPSCASIEFIAKVNAILRRHCADNQGVLLSVNGKLSVNCETCQVFVSGRRVKLTPIQYKLLCHLIKNQGRVCSSTELLQHVWGPNYSDEKELLKLSVYRLRSKIEEDPSNPEIIFNERGMGYVIRASSSTV
jgi:two-component system, OmpR family, KDP operon response regulator KdpE